MLKLLVDDRWNKSGIKRFYEELVIRIDPLFAVSRLTEGWHLTRALNPLNPIWLAGELRRMRPDVFWSPGFMSPISSPVPFIFTVHDLIHARSARGVRAAYFQLVLRKLCKRAYKIVTVSEFSRNEICEWAGLSPDRVVRIYNAVSRSFTSDGWKFSPGYPYLLYVGVHTAHKNLHRTLQAFARSGLSSQCKLLFSGEQNPALRAAARELGIGDSLQFAGFISDADLPAYYRGALGLVMLSTYEGFGLPLLEAMACGTPVLCSNVTSLPEVAGDAAFMVNPIDIDEMADGIRRIVCDESLRTELIAKGLAHCLRFSWDESARELSNLLIEATETGKEGGSCRR